MSRRLAAAGWPRLPGGEGVEEEPVQLVLVFEVWKTLGEIVASYRLGGGMLISQIRNRK